MAELAERLGLNLTNALARHAKLLPYLLQSARLTVHEPEAKLQDPPLAGTQ